MFLIFAISLLSLTGSGMDTYPKNPGIDMLHYAFEFTLSDETDVIDGLATIHARYLEAGQSQLRLDLIETAGALEGKGMTVAWIRMDGEDLSYRHEDDQLFIDLGRSIASMERIQVQVKYSGIPATGLIIAPNKYGDRSFFSDNWPNKARNWLPTVDHPYDKATSEMRITAPDHYQVISNGLKAEETDRQDGTRFTHWKQSVPIATWLYMVGVSPFAVQYVDTFEGKSIQTWVYPQDRDAGFYDYAVPTKQALAYYSDMIGPFAYEKLANVICNSVGGGMEAASSICYGDRSISGTRNPRWQYIIVHEIAHQWFGNAVTEYDWDDVWLSEGFATYFTLLFREYAYGRDNFVQGLQEARQQVYLFYDDPERYDFRIIHDNLDDMRRVTNAMTYQKGAWTLHMLREKIGVDAFWAGVSAYYNHFYNGNASTDDFVRFMEEASEQELDGFIDQWLKQGGALQLDIEWKQSGESTNFEINQVQPGYTFTFDLVLDVHLEEGTVLRETVKVMPNEATRIELHTPSTVTSVVVDPDTQLLARWEIAEME